MDTEAGYIFTSVDIVFLTIVLALLIAAHGAVVAKLCREKSLAQVFPIESSTAANVAVPVSQVAKVQPTPWRELEFLSSEDGLYATAHRARIEQLGVMSAAIAHEVRQPLTVIMQTGAAVKRRLANAAPDSVKINAMIDEIVDASRDAHQVIQRVQAMTRREPVPFRAVDLNALVTQVLHDYRPEAVRRGVGSTLELTPDLPAVQGDATQLNQVFGNLIRNSFDAMADVGIGQRRLALRTILVDAKTVSVEVRDTGCGLLPEVQAKMFLPFQTAKLDGIGLGLSICESIARAHDGRITGANNPDGAGAVFVLTLPVIPPPGNTDAEFNEIPEDYLCHR